MGHSKSTSKGKVYSNTSFPQERRNISDKNLTLHLKKLEKEEKIKPEVSRRNEIIMIITEIDEIETKKTIERINETESWFFERMKRIDKALARLIKKRGRRSK